MSNQTHLVGTSGADKRREARSSIAIAIPLAIGSLAATYYFRDSWLIALGLGGLLVSGYLGLIKGVIKMWINKE